MEQLTIFDVMDETKNKLYEVIEKNGLDYKIHKYYLYSDYQGAVQYYYIRTTDNTIIDLCLSDFPEIFAIHKGFSDKEIKKFTNGTYKSK
ncbi:hypothetical protein DPQ26_17860 [Bacillus sp. E25]|nr:MULTISPECIES: hypothetical protein [unclassified Bacillus (in: firmicutes)]AXR17814.1 hypothetical protein DOS87_17830 [Bacillus sp. CR71]AXR23547.1 hypothetical protein DPQ26_17860 [Bacillus sp. E25]